MDNQDRSSVRPTRAKLACSACRSRKVRCDVTHRGSPCTNCFLDHKECNIDAAPRNRGRIPAQRKRAHTQRDKPTTPDSQVVPQTTDAKSSLDDSTSTASPRSSPPLTLPSLLSLLQTDTDIVDEEPTETGPAAGDINFSVYRFLCTEFLLELPQDDLKYLEEQTCLRVPRRELLNEMLIQYFRHIHPLLPLFDEAQFWAMYHPVKYSRMEGSGDQISLFVLQAMLFVASSFLPCSKLRCLGFNSAHHARKCLYHRAKVLYSLEAETKPASLAQGALLLSLWCPRENNRQINTWWLTVAIQHARAGHAHRYKQIAPSRCQLELKRLWWSCIVRDRVMALCLRQPVHITGETFDFEGSKMTVNDIKGENAVPGVYEDDVGRVLYLLTISMCDLCIALTDVINLVYPQLPCAIHLPEKCSQQAESARGSLNRWHEAMTYQLSIFPLHTRTSPSVTLFSNLLQLYFLSSSILLANYEIGLQVELHPPHSRNKDAIAYSRLQIQECARFIADILQQLSKLDLIRYLPLSAVACTAKPLLLYLLDQVLINGVSATINTKLRVLLEAMKICKETYDYADLVLNTAHRISLEAQTLAQDQVILGWEDMLSQNPHAYLRFITAMDVAIAKGAFPKESDLPSALQQVRDGDRRAQLDILCAGEVNASTSHEIPVGPSTGCALNRTPHLSSPHRGPHAALLIPNCDTSEDATRDEAMACRPLESVENRESLLIESEALLQNLLASYLHESSWNTVDSLWPVDIL
ncbi:hypothetical protein BDW75DRAFT_243429 [Aspergillus navahoensis]